LNRRDALKSGTIDLLHTTNGETIAEMRDTKEFPMVEINNKAEVGYTLLHVTQDGHRCKTPCSLCTCLRVGRAVDHRHDQRRCRPARDGRSHPTRSDSSTTPATR
jgi:hypothetical protein